MSKLFLRGPKNHKSILGSIGPKAKDSPNYRASVGPLADQTTLSRNGRADVISGRDGRAYVSSCRDGRACMGNG